MLTWSDLKQYDCKTPLLKLTRVPIIQAQYEQHKLDVKEQGLTLEKIVEANVLKDRNRSLVPNSYPYDIQPNIKHMILWMRPGYEQTVQDTKRILEKRLGTDVIVFNNNEENKSIKGMPHYHVFIQESTFFCGEN